MKLQYHQKAFGLLGKEAQFVSSMKHLECLPPSVREWYSLTDGISLLEQYSNQDVPLVPSDFRICTHDEMQLAVFMYENQGVCWWAYKIDETDDPQIFF